MLKGRVQNGVALDSKGRAKVNAAARAELDLLTKANSIVRSATKPADSVQKKMRKAWNWMQKKRRETSSRKFHNRLGWHRSYAHEILFDRHGACESMGAGYAHLAQACGAKRCSAVATGGHGWADINHRVYDPEWSRHVSGEIYGKPYSYFPHGGAVAATIQPRTGVWSKAKERVSVKRGLGICMIAPGYEDEDGSISRYTYKHAIVEVFVSGVDGREYVFNVLDR